MYVGPQELAEIIPVNRGDIVYIASDVTNICVNAIQEGESFDLNLFISLLQNKIGDEGTLLFPTFNWKFCRGLPYDYLHARSKTGALGQTALQREDFVRTRHAIYSFAVWGRDSDLLLKMNDSNSFVGDTTFEYLYKNNGKMIMLDAEMCFTFLHYVEEAVGVKYRFLKKFYGEYIDAAREKTQRMYSMYVRYLDERAVETNPDADAWFLDVGVFKNVENPYVKIWECEFGNAYRVLEDDIINHNAEHLVVYTGSAYHEGQYGK